MLLECFDSNFLGSRRVSRIRSLRYTTQLYRLFQHSNWYFCTTFPRLFAGLSFCLKMSENGICRHVHILFQICNSDIRDDAIIYMTDFLQTLNRHGISLFQRAFLFIVWHWGCFVCLSPSVCFAFEWDAGEDDRPLVSDFCHSFQGLLDHDWNCKSIVHVPSTENTLPLSSQLRLSFFVSWWLIPSPQHRSGLWSFEFSSSGQNEVLQLSSIVNSTAPCFAPFIDHTKPTQSEVEQNSVILTCTILPGSYLRAFHSQVIEQHPIWRRNLEHRHFCVLVVNKVESLCTASWALVASYIIYIHHVHNLSSS